MGKPKFYQKGHEKDSHKCSQSKSKTQPCSSSLCRDCGHHFVVRTDVLGKIICKPCFRHFEKKGEKPKYEETDVVVVPRQTLVLGFNKNRIKSNGFDARYDNEYEPEDYYEPEDDYESEEEDQYTLIQSMCPPTCDDCGGGRCTGLCA
jgi:hypothetical protein